MKSKRKSYRRKRPKHKTLRRRGKSKITKGNIKYRKKRDTRKNRKNHRGGVLGDDSIKRQMQGSEKITALTLLHRDSLRACEAEKVALKAKITELEDRQTALETEKITELEDHQTALETEKIIREHLEKLENNPFHVKFIPEKYQLQMLKEVGEAIKEMPFGLTLITENVQQKIPEAVGFATAKVPFYADKVSPTTTKMPGFRRGKEAFDEEQRQQRHAI